MLAKAVFFITAVVVLICSFVSAADWPQFRGPGRSGRSLETDLLDTWPEGGPNEKWAYQGLGRGFSSVAVVDDTVYTTGMIDETGYVFALAKNGELLWKTPYGPEWTGSYPGTRTTPTIDFDRLYIMSGQGTIACLDRFTGSMIWKIDTAERFGGRNITWGIAESVLVDGDKVFCTPGGKDATMVALNKHTGETIWTTKGLSARSAYCSPVIWNAYQQRPIATMVEKLIIAVDSETGEVLDKIPHETKNDIAAVTPFPYCQGRTYFTSHGTGGRMLRISHTTGKIETLWETTELDSLHGGVVLTTAGLAGSDSKGNWTVLGILKGETLYKGRLLDAKGTLIAADRRLYCYSEKGTLALVNSDRTGLEVISSFKITKGTHEHWAHPAISNGILYIRHGDTLIAYDIKDK